MKIITLLDNNTVSEVYKARHGLSLYIETKNHKILFDMGPNEDYIDNAKKLGVDLKAVDIAILSHGHNDHGGGLEGFLRLNDKAPIYIGREAFNRHYKQKRRYYKKDIGLDKSLENNERLIRIDGCHKVDDELTLFNGITGDTLVPLGNFSLLKREKYGKIKRDDFEHEINLLIHEDDQDTLLSGCAHKGIVNIVNKANELISTPVNTVVGGFHLRKLNGETKEGRKFLDTLAELLSHNGVETYYTCHCTGDAAFEYLDKKMDNIKQLKTGMDIEI